MQLLMNEYERPMNTGLARRYEIGLPAYDVIDADSGEVLSERITMREVVRRHGDMITSVKLVRNPLGKAY